MAPQIFSPAQISLLRKTPQEPMFKSDFNNHLPPTKFTCVVFPVQVNGTISYPIIEP